MVQVNLSIRFVVTEKETLLITQQVLRGVPVVEKELMGQKVTTLSDFIKY